jgi:hypothetical protein
MRTRLTWVAVAAVLTGACGSEVATPASAQLEGLSLVSIQPSSGPASLGRSRPVDCAWCTTAFSAELQVTSPSTLDGVNLWLDGWSGNRRCLTSQHDSPADGFTLAGGRPVLVTFSHASVDCAPPFTIDRVTARVRSGETLVYEGSWTVNLTFVD